MFSFLASSLQILSGCSDCDRKVCLVRYINSGYTVRDSALGVVRGPLGNVELLTLTLSLPCNWKRY